MSHFETRRRLAIMSLAVLVAVLMPLCLAVPESNSEEAEFVEIIEALRPGPMDPAELQSALGEPDQHRVGNQLYEGFRRGHLEALCTEKALGSGLPDRTLQTGNVRTEHYLVYESLGATFLFLDNPWRLYRFWVANPNVLIKHMRPGMTVGQVDDHYGYKGEYAPYTPDDVQCCELWVEGVLGHYSCSPSEFQNQLAWPEIRRKKPLDKLEVYDTELPTGCWLSIRGQYMPWALEDADFE